MDLLTNYAIQNGSNGSKSMLPPLLLPAADGSGSGSSGSSGVIEAEPDLTVINRTILFVTANAVNASDSSTTNGMILSSNSSSNNNIINNNKNIPSTLFMSATNATNVMYNNITNVSNAHPPTNGTDAADIWTSDVEWARFYDLMFSWQGICLIAVFSTLIVVTIIGNMLVILAVITTRRLKTVTNCFVMSLAVADLLVGIFVMPPAVAVHLIGSWRLGWVLCDIWISLDVLLCTASILSLCAISVDRYLAVTQPLTYSRRRRSKRLAFLMILIVWVLALAITCPPMLGWYEPGRRDLNECRYNQNEGYVIFSAMGSFFIPMAVMIYVYARISCVVAARHDHMTDISVHNKKFKRYTTADIDHDIEHDISEQELSSSQRKQAAARTFSNQTIAKELQDVLLSEGGGCFGVGGVADERKATMTTTTTTTIVASRSNNGHDNGGDASSFTHCPSLLTLATAATAATNTTKNSSCYELTRPSSLKRTPTSSSSTMTVMISGCGSGSGGPSSLLTPGAPPPPAGGYIATNAASDPQHWSSRTLSVRQQQQYQQQHNHPHAHHHHHQHHHHQQQQQQHFGIASGSSSPGVNTTNTSPNLQTAEAVTLTRQIRIQQQQQQSQQQQPSIAPPPLAQQPQRHHHHNKSFSNRISSLKKENKTTQTLSIVVGGFIACWLPFFIYYLITPFLEEHQVSRTLAKALTWLGWFNSAINPFIYAFYSVDFRTAFWRLTCKRFFSGSMKAQFPTNTMSIRR